MLGQLLHDTYRLERMVGRGAMGAVYEAVHLRLHRKFAVKIVDTTLSEKREFIERFQREAQVTSSIGHPHIIDVVDFNITAEGIAYIAMELLDGENLKQRLDREGILSIGRAASILRQTTSALQAAHTNGVIHRDLKPSNIFLCVRGERDDYVKVLDFGISKVLGSMLTQTHATLGTPCYMAPEQALGRTSQVDRYSDIFSLGTITYQMLSGKLPFHGDSPPETMHQVVYSEPPYLCSVNAEIPDAIAVVVHKALNKRPQERHQSMYDFWNELALAMGKADLVFEESTEDRSDDWNRPRSGAYATSEAVDPMVHRTAATVHPGKPLASKSASKRRERKKTETVVPIAMSSSRSSKVTDFLKEAINLSTFRISGIWSQRPVKRIMIPIGVGLVLLTTVLVFVFGRGKRSEIEPSTAIANPNSSMEQASDLRVGDVEVMERKRDLSMGTASTEQRSNETVVQRVLSLSTEPLGAEVWGNRKRLGVTPLREIVIPTEQIELVLKKESFQDHYILVVAGKTPVTLGTVKLKAVVNKDVGSRATKKPQATDEMTKSRRKRLGERVILEY